MTRPADTHAAPEDMRASLWRALGEASRWKKGDPPYLDRLLVALARNGLVIRRV